MKKDDDKRPCPDCGAPMHEYSLPRLTAEHFDAAKDLVQFLWLTSRDERELGEHISVMCLAAALVFKRVSVALKIPAEDVHGLAGLYIDAAHGIILRRRAAAAAADKEAN